MTELFRPLQSHAQREGMKFENITVADGLAENSAMAMRQDQFGFIWIATQNGLQKYDGHDFTLYQYNEQDTTTIADNLVSNIWEDWDGNIWTFSSVVNLKNRLSKLDRKTEQFQRLGNPLIQYESWINSSELTSYTMTKDGMFWMSSLRDGVLMVNPKTGTSRHLGQNDGLLLDEVVFMKYESDLLWLGYSDNRISSYHPETAEWKHYSVLSKNAKIDPSFQIKDISSNKESLLYVTLGSISMSSVWQLNLNRQQEEIIMPPTEANVNRGWITHIDRQNNLWTRIQGEIKIFDTKTNKEKISLPFDKSEGAMFKGEPFVILEDKSGVIWLGTRNYGIFKWDPLIEKIALLKIPQQENTTQFVPTMGLVELDNGDIWQSSSFGIKRIRKDQNFQIDHFSNLVNADQRNGYQLFADSKNNLWADHNTNWDLDTTIIPLWQLKPNSNTLIPHSLNGIPKKGFLDIIKMVEDNTGTLWMGTSVSQGLLRYHPDSRVVKQYLSESNNPKSIPSNNPTALLWDEDANCLWVGTSYENGRFCRFDPNTEVFTPFPLQPEKANDFYIETIHKDQQNRLWVGGFTGLYFVDQKTGANRQYGKKDGLSQDIIYKIIEDEDDNLWIVHEYSISKLRFSKGDFPKLLSVVIYDQSDGLANARLHPWGIIKSSNGRVYIGSPVGINYFDFDKIIPNLFKPPLSLTDIKIKGEITEIGADAPLQAHINVAKSIQLSHHQNDLAISFSGLHFSQPRKNKFSYQLLPYEKGWSHPSTNRVAKYTNLDPGQYTFKVKGSNGDGVWNEEGISLDIFIAAPWWKTWWAYGLYGLSFIALVFLADRAQNKRLIKKERLKTQERELAQAKKIKKAYHDLKAAQTQLIQSEKMASLGELTAGIAHEIQNPLNFVNNFSEVSQELLEELKEEIAEGNMEDITEIVDYLTINLQKINEHGVRASTIIQSMLEHSRNPSKVKEPTDLNLLCGKYLKLAFHGFRAKDKSFTANFTTDFATNLPLIAVTKQDMERVILNLVNNAFFAVNEKSKLDLPNYEPTVHITTEVVVAKKMVLIQIKDNGNGIPNNIIDKIFQPFFTTKETNKGTGLGLSLSFDVVTKGHGGQLKVSSTEGEGTTFSIELPVF